MSPKEKKFEQTESWNIIPKRTFARQLEFEFTKYYGSSNIYIYVYYAKHRFKKFEDILGKIDCRLCIDTRNVPRLDLIAGSRSATYSVFESYRIFYKTYRGMFSSFRKNESSYTNSEKELPIYSSCEQSVSIFTNVLKDWNSVLLLVDSESQFMEYKHYIDENLIELDRIPSWIFFSEDRTPFVYSSEF